MPAALTAVDCLIEMKGAAFTFLVVAAAFAGTLFLGGRVLGAWGDPGKELVAPPVKELPKLKAVAPVKRVSSEWERWVDAANAHCSRVVSEVTLLDEPRTPQEARAYVQRFWQLNKDWTGRLAGLPAPRGFRPQVARLRRLSDRYSSLVDRMLSALRRGDAVTYQAAVLDMAGTVNAEVDVLARMGADGCVAASHT
jgi:hypothetical protein